ncbi:MAG: hypothetical protein KC733_12025, partial [Candidatus Omnitrophica bacterium]|nr:hypothetical protein [Candidatus Omnitrophota bacterium]
MLSATLIWSPTLQATPRTRNTNISLQEKQKYGGTLVWGVTNPPTIINPLLTTHSISMGIIDLVFNGLIRIDEKGKLEPDLAERWEISEDKLTYTFYLRKGIHFHNGEELTAVDVAYTYEQLKDPFIQSTAWSHFNVVKEIKVVNKY